MTPNLTSARKAIQAELSHARQGEAFYTARVEALETALTQLEIVDTDDAELLESEERKSSTKTGAKKKAGKLGRPARNATSATTAAAASDKRGRKAANGASQRSRRGQKQAKGQEGSLPTTGTDFWLDLVTDEPRSAVDIANAAAAHLGLGTEQKTQVQKLKQRVAPALASLVTSQKIQHTGAGRQRRYFRDSAKQSAE